MTTRLCVRCQREKSIRGVWYLTPAHAFVCEGCFVGAVTPEPMVS